MQDSKQIHLDLYREPSLPTEARPPAVATGAASKTMTTLDIRFDLPLQPRQVGQWRGAFAQAADPQQDLFHNHQNEGGADIGQKYHYRYPLIHYRTSRNRAAVWAMGTGIEHLADWLRTAPETIRLGEHRFPLQATDIITRRHTLQMTEEWHTYRLLDYLPLNQENFDRWQNAPGLIERIEILERTLVGHVFGFANALQWQLPRRLELKLLNINKMRPVNIHGHQRLAFKLLFQANIQLPGGIALGRSVAFGFGVLRPARKRILP